jgi:hypothetical protein
MLNREENERPGALPSGEVGLFRVMSTDCIVWSVLAEIIAIIRTRFPVRLQFYAECFSE